MWVSLKLIGIVPESLLKSQETVLLVKSGRRRFPLLMGNHTKAMKKD